MQSSGLKRLFAVVEQCGGCHHMFDADWIGGVDSADLIDQDLGVPPGDSGLRPEDRCLSVGRCRCDGYRGLLIALTLVPALLGFAGIRVAAFTRLPLLGNRAARTARRTT